MNNFEPISYEPFLATPPKDGKTWFLRVPYGKMPKKVILTLLLDMPTDNILPYMENVEKISEFGEYIVYKGVFEGEEIGVVYHASGTFSMTTAIEELAQLGVTCMLRAGNSGGLAEEVHVGDYILVDCAIRADQTMCDYIPPEFPAVADINMILSGRAAMESQGVPYHEGLVVSASTFYAGGGCPTARGIFDPAPIPRLHMWKKTGALIIDIETSAVLVMGRLFGIRSGSLLGVGDHTCREEGSYMSLESRKQLALLALKTIRGCAE